MQMKERESVEVVTRVAAIHLEPSGIIHLACKAGVEYTIRDAKEDLAAVDQVIEGKRRPLLVDGREVRAVDQETRTFWSGAEMLKYFKAVAVVTGNSSITNMIGNFMITIARPVTPMKLFTSEQDALKWLEWFLDDDHDGPPPSRRIFGIELGPSSRRSPQDGAPASKRWGQQDAAPASKRSGQQEAAPSTKRGAQQDPTPPSKRSP
jgi:hypothetical protein